MVEHRGRVHAQSYTVPASGAWTGPALMAGSADASASSTALTAALRSGDYQIGTNAQLTEGFGAQIALYRDATFELGFTRYFDTAKRLTKRKDRTGLAIDATTIPAPARQVRSGTRGLGTRSSRAFPSSPSVPARRAEVPSSPRP